MPSSIGMLPLKPQPAKILQKTFTFFIQDSIFSILSSNVSGKAGENLGPSMGDSAQINIEVSVKSIIYLYPRFALEVFNRAGRPNGTLMGQVNNGLGQ